MGSAVASGAVASLNLSTGIPAPDTLAAAAVRPGHQHLHAGPSLVGHQRRRHQQRGGLCEARSGRRRAGCPRCIRAGASGCTASDHLEITYDTGDKVSLTYTETASSFDLTVAVIAGAWTGTNPTTRATSTPPAPASA